MKNLYLLLPALALFATPALADTCNLNFPSCDDMGYTDTLGDCVGKYTVCPSDPNRVTCINGPSVGAIKYSYQTDNHKGWLLCNGQEVDKNTYLALFNVIGTDFGGSGNKFKLPDYRGYFLRGYGGIYGANTNTKVPQRQELPNITGTMTLDTNAFNSGHLTGSFWQDSSVKGDWSASNGGGAYAINFSASSANSIYTENGHVIPANYALNIFIYAGQ